MKLKRICLTTGLAFVLLAGCGTNNSQNASSSQASESASSQMASTQTSKSQTTDVHSADYQPPAPTQDVTHFVNHDKITDNDFFVDAQWLKGKLDQNKDQQNLKVVEATYGDEAYNKGHIPGAIHIDTMDVESEDSDWNLFEPDKLAKTFLDRGITHDTELVVYADDVNAASRVAFAAYYLGVDKVKILDGGRKAWESLGQELTKDAPTVTVAKDFGVKYPARPDIYIKTSDDLLKAQESNPDLVVASVRSWPEFMGKTSGYDYIDKAGEIFGAVWAAASETAYDLNYFTNEDGTLKDPTPIFNMWKDWGITKDKDVTFYCGTGWRNTAVFFITRQAGWDKTSVQDGGWYEWNLKHKKDPVRYQVQIGNPLSDDYKIERS
ncbi:MAG: rhodanese-like domain-containing protein [Aerococcus sp.]|nr:rhodanese-like domain-containing protein [Aerococcus sp.]